MLEGELRDHRLMIKQTDKYMAEIRAERDNLKQASTLAESQVNRFLFICF